MKQKIIAVLVLMLSLTMLLSACSGGGAGSSDKNSSVNESYQSDGVAENEEASSSSSENPAADTGRKIIITEYYDYETRDIDKAVAELEKLISSTGCYCESSNVSGNTANGGYADYTVRVPADSLGGFTSSLSAIGNLTSKRRGSEDVTIAYYDNEAKIASLQVQQERLMALLEKADNLSDILLLEEELTKVRSQLESLTTDRNRYDNLVNYSTVNINIRQVKTFTEQEQEGFFAELWSNFKRAFSTFGTVMKHLLFVFVWFLPYILLFAVIFAVVFVIVKLAKNKKKNK